MSDQVRTPLLLSVLLVACAGFPTAGSEPVPAVCTAAPESTECSDALEHAALAQSPLGVARREAVLEFVFSNGTALQLEDSSSEGPAGQAVLYRYHGYLAAQHAHIVHLHYYEGDSFLLISAVSGRTRDLAGPPALSPDQARFMSYSVSGGYSVAELQVWRIATDLPELELRVRPSSWEPRGAHWAGAAHIAVPPQQAPGATEAWETTVHLGLAEGVWTIRAEARCRLTSGCS